MVKSLANELSDILDWIDSAGLTQVENTRTGLVCFCRGLVCGLRTADEGLPDKSESGLAKADDVADSLGERLKGDISLQQRIKEEDEGLRKRMKYDIPMMGKDSN